MIELYHPHRVLRRQANGSVIPVLRGSFTVQAPAAGQLRYAVYDTANAQIIAPTVIDAAWIVYNGPDFTITLPALARSDQSKFWIKLERNDYADGIWRGVRTPWLQRGLIVGGYGQSLETLAAPRSYTSPQVGDYVVMVDGEPTTQVIARHANKISGAAASALKALVDVMLAELPDTTNGAFAYVAGGRQGTNASQRMVGGSVHNAFLNALMDAGNDLDALIIVDGQNEGSNTTGVAITAYPTNILIAPNAGAADIATNYETWMDASIDAIEAQAGHTFPVILCPAANFWGAASNVNFEAMRRKQWDIVRRKPSRYFKGPYALDLQHSDAFHLTSYVEYKRRQGLALAHTLGLITADEAEFGPSLASASILSSSSLRVVFDLNGASALNLLNAGGTASGTQAAEYRGGLRFATTTNFAAPLSPTGATINAVAGTQQSIDYTFAGTPFGATAYVSGPYGADPFNPADNTTIRPNIASFATILQGIYGSNNIGVQPCYQASGADYLTAV